MDYKQSRLDAGLKQTDVIERLQAKGINIDVSILSRFENGYDKNFELLEKELSELYAEGNIRTETTSAEFDGNVDLQVIYNCIPIGSKNGITKVELCKRLSMDERTIRKLIHEARRYAPILNLQNGKGYFIPDKNNEADMLLLNKWIAQETNRAKSTFWSLRGAKKYLKAI